MENQVVRIILSPPGVLRLGEVGWVWLGLAWLLAGWAGLLAGRVVMVDISSPAVIDAM